MKLVTLLGRMVEHIKTRRKKVQTGQAPFSLTDMEVLPCLGKMIAAIRYNDYGSFKTGFDDCMERKNEFKSLCKDAEFEESQIYQKFFYSDGMAQQWWANQNINNAAAVAKVSEDSDSTSSSDGMAQQWWGTRNNNNAVTVAEVSEESDSTSSFSF